jgi:DNA polymerase-3 subunit alpha
MSGFVHLHTHSHYSLLNALPKVKALVARAKECGMDALALTDSGNLYAAIEFYKTCQDEGIKPIIGVDFYVAVRSRHDKQPGIDNKRHRLVLLAENTTGYQNLIQLVTTSFLDGFYYKPRIDRDLMRKHTDGLIVILPSFSSSTSTHLKNGAIDQAAKEIAEYKEMYGTNNVFLEITHHPEIPNHEDLMKKVVELGKETDTPLVAAHDVYYINLDDREARNTLLAVQGRMSGDGALTNDSEDFSFIDQSTAAEYFQNYPEALTNTEAIAARCNLTIELGNWSFPQITLPAGKTADEELRRLAYEGIPKRGMSATPDITERIDYELGVIGSKGYAAYFLIVADLLRYASENDIYTNIRGSVAGSLVTYLIGITKLNPLEYDLLFERFLNPDRPSAPDIDMDFADNRRDEILAYARSHYGEDKVAQIGTFGTMMARGAIRDVARALGYPYALGDQISKMIPLGKQGFTMTIDRALEEEPELAKLYKQNPDAHEVIDMAKKVEGCARHISVHAAGVVIAPTKLTDFTPLQIDPKGGKLITQFDMHAVEDAGLVKFDFLGLKNLAILADTVKRIAWRRKENIDLDHIPMDDPKTFALLSRGETHSTFQLNGAGMTAYLKELKPTNIHDINAMVALYRPGPMEFIPEYIRRKNNPRAIDYPHELMRGPLEKSLGLLIYQEDVMLTAIKLAGYTWLEADKFRKAMGKKIPELMAEQEEKFKSGCVKNGIEKAKADDLWERIKPFAAYAFNKAHSASYGRIAYQTAYLKANYTVEYMAAILTADSGNVDKVADGVRECARLKIPILAPNINESFGTFTIVDDQETASIRFGLYSIKNFGEHIADEVIAERQKNGKFTSLADFLERVHGRNLNKKSLETLIKCGALDEFGERGQMLANIDRLLGYNRESMNKADGQGTLFGLMSDTSTVPTLTLDPAPLVSKNEQLAWEKELLGLYISGHPLDEWREQLAARQFNIRSIKEKMKEGMTAVPAGMIEEAKVILTKKGQKMAFLQIADFSGSIEVVIFPDLFTEHEALLAPDTCVVIKGRLSHRNQTESIVAEAIKRL